MLRLALGTLCLLMTVAGSTAAAQGYYRSYKTNCISATAPIGYASTGQVKTTNVYRCGQAPLQSFYLAGASGPDFSKEIYVYVPNYGGTRAVNNAFPIYIRPGVSYNFDRSSVLAKIIEGSAASVRDVPLQPWSSATMTPPFLPTWWVNKAGMDSSVTGLKMMPNWPYARGPLTYNSRIVLFGGTSFRKHTDFVEALANREQKAIRADAMTHRHVLIVYRNSEDPSGTGRMALVPFVPVSMVRPQFNQLTSEFDVKTFALGDLGTLARAMAPFYAAYVFYEESGMAESDRQRCAKWRAEGAHPELRPTGLPCD